MRIHSRYQAFMAHLSCSAVVASLCAAVVFLGWYQWPLVAAAGAGNIFLLLLAVDVVLGPVLTMVVFDRRKKELQRDLAIVVLIQVAALAYGMHSMFVARPVFLVYAIDRIELVLANELDPEEVAKAPPEFRDLPLWRPKLIAALRPEDAAKRRELLFGALSGGSDLHQLPQYYAPFDRVTEQVKARARSLSDLADLNPAAKTHVASLLNKHEQDQNRSGYLPLRGRVEDLSVIVDRPTGAVKEIVRLRPWRD